MKNKKGLLILSAVVVVCAVGFIVSPLVDWSVDKDSTSGNIGKSSRFSRKTATESISNMEELLQNDPAYKNSLVTAYVVMNTRAQQFGALVDMSNEAAGNLPEFADVLKDMNDARATVDNVCASLQQAGEDLNASLGGESCPDLAQSTINASLAYTTLQKQNKLAGRFIDTTDKYLETAEGDNRLKFVRDEWVDYQLMTAALEGDEESAEALQQKGSLLSAEQAVAALGSFPIVNQIMVLESAGLSNTMNVSNNLVGAVPSEVLGRIYVLVSNATQEVVGNATQEVVGNATREVVSNVTQEMVANALAKELSNTAAGKNFLNNMGWENDVISANVTQTLGANAGSGHPIRPAQRRDPILDAQASVEPAVTDISVRLGNTPFVMSAFVSEVVPALNAAAMTSEAVQQTLFNQVNEVISNTAAGEKASLRFF